MPQMTLELSEKEMQLLEELAVKRHMSKAGLLRQAIRLYQAVDTKISQGHRLVYKSGDVDTEILFIR